MLIVKGRTVCVDLELKMKRIKELQDEIDLRTWAERRVEYFISEGMMEEALELITDFEKEAIF